MTLLVGLINLLTTLCYLWLLFADSAKPPDIPLQHDEAQGKSLALFDHNYHDHRIDCGVIGPNTLYHECTQQRREIHVSLRDVLNGRCSELHTNSDISGIAGDCDTGDGAHAGELLGMGRNLVLQFDVPADACGSWIYMPWET